MLMPLKLRAPFLSLLPVTTAGMETTSSCMAHGRDQCVNCDRAEKTAEERSVITAYTVPQWTPLVFPSFQYNLLSRQVLNEVETSCNASWVFDLARAGYYKTEAYLMVTVVLMLFSGPLPWLTRD